MTHGVLVPMGKVSVIHVASVAGEGTHDHEVRYSGVHLELVFMSLKKNGEIGEETHRGDQFIRVEAGAALAVIGGEEYALSAGEAVFISENVPHNIINMGDDELTLSALYAPPKYMDEAVHRDKPSEVKASSGKGTMEKKE